MHPVSLRCSSVKYPRYSPSSRLARRPPIPGYEVVGLTNQESGSGRLGTLDACPYLADGTLSAREARRVPFQVTLALAVGKVETQPHQAQGDDDGLGKNKQCRVQDAPLVHGRAELERLPG
jgi:hypothetical protein